MRASTPVALAAIQTAIRADVDVLVFGEMRDAETRSALVACESGRLVLGTMNSRERGEGDRRHRRSTFRRRSDPGSFEPRASLQFVDWPAPRSRASTAQRLHAAVELLPWSAAASWRRARWTVTEQFRTFSSEQSSRRRAPRRVARELVRAQKVTLEGAQAVR